MTWKAVTLHVDYRQDPSPLAISGSHSCWCQWKLDEAPGQQQALRMGAQDEASPTLRSSPSTATTLPSGLSVLIRIYNTSHCCHASSTGQWRDQTGTVERRSTSYSDTCRMLEGNQPQFLIQNQENPAGGCAP